MIKIQIRHNMAFLSKVGRIFRQTSTHVTASNSMLQSIRCMSSSKIFVGGISYSTDEFGLREAFSKYGEVVDAKIIVDRETGRSRGFAFVTFTSTEEASNAMQLDGQDLHGRRIRVNYATERGSGFGGRGFGGPGGGYGAAGGGYGGGGAGGYGAPAGGYGGGSYGGNAGAYGGNSPYGGNAGGDGYGSNFGGGYGVAGGVGGSDNFAQGSSSSAGFDDKFSSDVPLGNDTDHQLESLAMTINLVAQRTVNQRLAQMGDTVGSFVYGPCEVIKQRMQIQSTSSSWSSFISRKSVPVKPRGDMYGYYTGMFQAGCSIWKEQGPKGLYAGYWSTLARDVPFAGLMVSFYEALKDLTDEGKKKFPQFGVNSSVEGLVLGGLAGGLGAYLTTPLDVVKTRLPVQGTTIKYVSSEIGKQHPQGISRTCFD
ncbi:hypothetical protein Bca52824_052960 [Brassica carinata]|uniref:RRM domain-containing protein n=1 Tax=Brassica carinata TaxID=52824 RepID=A0A8X7R761_BRACI|nr:hypothetical protein Bca52824_052960 [Brassica carinata]